MLNKDIYTIIVQVIHEVTGLEKNEIDLEADLTEDLDIDPVSTFPQIIRSINEELNVDLPLGSPEFIAELKKCDTVADLVDLIETESEF